MAKGHLSPSEEMQLIRRKMAGLEWEPEAKFMFRHPSKRWRSIIGTDEGTRYGAMIEFHGGESGGKTARASETAGLAAANDGAIPIWMAFEPWVEEWHNAWGLYFRNPAPKDSGSECLVIEPYMLLDVKPPAKILKSPEKLKQFVKDALKTKEAQITSANRMCDEAEQYIRWKAKETNRKRPFVLVVDSVTAMNTAMEDAAGIEHQNMRTKLGLPAFMSQLLRRWTGLFTTLNVLGVFINQTRVDPNKMFGNPETTPGGKALKFYCDVRVGLRRASGGKVVVGSQQVGIQGVAKNIKNKLGGLEYSETGYQIFFEGKTKHMAKKDLPKFKGAAD